jgi:hypothetical protein
VWLTYRRVVDRIDWNAYFAEQARTCQRDGSPLYAELVEDLAGNFRAGGVVADLVSDWHGHPLLDAVAMRLLGAVHHLVLDGRCAELARHYPSVGGHPVFPGAAKAFLAAIAEHRSWIRARLDEPVQTNEVRRSAALLGGFLQVAHETGLPLSLLELGASAGLNQIWDRHRYELGPHRWGEPEAPLCLRTEWHGAAPALTARVAVRERAGCDLAPIDMRCDGSLRRLESFIWPDQPERLERLRSAARLALDAGIAIDASGAIAWLESRLAPPRSGAATVVFHSVLWWYLSREEQDGLVRSLERAGAAATSDAPIAWLRMEGRDLERTDVRLRLWPGGEDRLLATSGYHAQRVDWLLPAASF